MPAPRIAIAPRSPSFVADAVTRGGGEVVEPGSPADGLVWLLPHSADRLTEVLAATPGVRWVQLPFAGVERFAEGDLFRDGRVWTCAKGSYAEPVAEHALALALAGLRHVPERVVARSWGEPAGTSLYDERVVVLGGGGIAEELIRQLAPFRVHVTAVRRRPEPVAGAAATITLDRLPAALPGALVVFLALALTPETSGVIDAGALAAMDERAWMVNVARGRHIVTGDLVDALRSGAIAGAGLDVTDPEPLPDGHPLWDLPNAIITPHTADTFEMTRPKLAERISVNVARLAAGEPLVGLVDPDAGY